MVLQYPEALHAEHSVLITPGAHFGIDDYFRVGYGYDIDMTCHALSLVSETLAELQPAAARA